MPTTRRVRTQESVFAKEVAKHYVKEVEKIRAVLKQKRKEYKEAAVKEKKAKTQEAIDALKEIMANADAEFEAEKSDWPYYKKYLFSRSRVISDGLDSAPYSPEADPFPGDGALMTLSMSERARIVDTAMLARRGVKDKKRFLEGLVPRLNSADSIHVFKHFIKKYINPRPYSSPPSYPRGSSEFDDEEEWEEYADSGVIGITPPANPFPGQRPNYRRRRTRGVYDRTPEGSPNIEQGTVAVPAYSPPDYELQGGITRKYKRSKNKRSNNKKTHKRSQNKRKKYSKRNKTYRK
jgi:hypothetical protein